MSERGQTVLAWVLGVALAAAVLWSASAAHADPPPCPEAPSAYEGSDAVVAELRALRAENVAGCIAVLDRLDAIRLRSNDIHDRLGVVDGRLVTVAENTTPVAEPQPAEVVEIAGVDPEDVGAKAESAINDLNQTLWWLGGALVGCLAGWALLKQVMPR